MNYKENKNVDKLNESVGFKNIDSKQQESGIENENTKFGEILDSAVDAGDTFFSIGSMICEFFMGLMSLIMRHAYLIAVIIVAILFVIKM